MLYVDIPVRLLGTMPDHAAKCMQYFKEHQDDLKYGQLSLWTAEKYKHLSVREQLQSGCGSFHYLNQGHVDEEFVVPVPGTEFLNPIIDHLQNNTQIFFGQRHMLCRPMLRQLSPKTCLSYHRDKAPVRIHLVLQTNDKVMFIIEDKVERMSYAGNLYCLKTDVMHTVVNASYDQARIHLTISAYPKDRP